MPWSGQLDERMQLGGSRSGEQAVPGIGPDRDDHGQVFGRVTEADRTHQAGDLRQCVVHRRLAVGADGGDQEDRGRSQRRQNRLRRDSRHSHDPNVPAIPVMLDMATWRPRHTACANSSTRPRRRFTSARRWRDGCSAPDTASCAKRIAGRTNRAGTSPSGLARWWRGTPSRAGTRRSHSGSSARTPTAPICGSSSIRTGSSPAGTWWRCNRMGSLAALLAGSRSGHQRAAIGA